METQEEKPIKKEEIKEVKKEKPKSFWNTISIAIVVAALIGAASGYLTIRILGPAVIKESQVNEVILERESAVVDVVENSSPAVVSIVVTKDMPRLRSFGQRDFFDFFFDPFGRMDGGGTEDGGTERQEIGGGTGFFVSKDGLIVTNKHVVSDDEADYTVVTNDDKEYSAKVLAKHPSLDIAVLKVDGDSDFPLLELGNSDELKVGQSVVAIGNPLGEFPNSVSLGIVSGLQRDITASAGFGQAERLTNIIQTDAAINPGNSGGPLLDIGGKVIGINVAVVSGAQSIGFALPINQVSEIVKQVKEKGEISVPYIGVRYVILNEAIQEENNLPYDYGALVIRGENITDLAVVPGSPADKAGVVENDVILEIDGEKITEDNTLADIINEHSVGDEITLKLWHKGDEKEIKVRLEERKN